MELSNEETPENSDEYNILNKQEAMAGILIVALNVGDGGEEIEFAIDQLSRMRLFRSESDSTFTPMIDKLVKISSEQGLDILFKKSLDALPDELRKTAYALTTDIFLFACGGGGMDKEKIEWLAVIQKLLKIPDELALKILEVMRLKYYEGEAQSPLVE